ncbi:B3 domain-containing protein At1g49475 [Linum grandiflorum]
MRRFYKVKVPRFVIILLLDPLEQGKLQLPEDFAEEHGAKLSNEVQLNLPNGAEWKVSVVRRGRKNIWFDKGWTEFAKFYSLEPTHFLIFELANHNQFNVIIFDTSSSEIDYSMKKSNVKFKSECDAASSDEAVERHPPSFNSPQPPTATATEADQNLRSTSRRRKPSTTKANVVFESEKPFFMVAMQKTYLTPGCKLSVPVNFFETNFIEKPGGILLQLTDVGVWKVEYLVIDYVRQKRSFFEAKSWKSFARANRLRVGDVCAFELVEGGNDARFNVVIFRASQDTGNHSEPSALEAANGFTSNHPFFVKAVTSPNLTSGYAYIPKEFWKYVKEASCKAKMELCVGSKSWHVTICRRKNQDGAETRVFMNGGWRKFARANSLVVGDVCVYELMDDVNVVARVHFFRG